MSDNSSRRFVGCIIALLIGVAFASMLGHVEAFQDDRGAGIVNRLNRLEGLLDGVKSISVGVLDVQNRRFVNATGVFRTATVGPAAGTIHIEGLNGVDVGKAVVVATPQGGPAEPYLMTAGRADNGSVVITTSKPNDAAAGQQAGSHQEVAGIVNIVLIVTR